MQNKTIAIVGGGPGGLTLARLLQLKGANVKVYERDVNKDVRVQGSTLDLHEESGLKALEVAGLMEAFNANFRPGAEKVRVVDRDGIVVLDEHGDTQASVAGAPIAQLSAARPEIDRGPLRKILLESLAPDTVVWNSHLASLSKTPNGWKLSFQNGTTALADIVIGADGANSKIRPFITPIKPFFADLTMVEGTVYHSETATPRIHELMAGGKIFALGDEKSLIVSSKGDGSLMFCTGCKTTEYWSRDSGIDFTDNAQVKDWFQQTFTGWDPIWLELFDGAEPRFIPRPQYCMPLDQSWDALPNLTMLGDAAHLMPPYAGEGVNMAMLDALELSECLSEFDIPEGIARYEQAMRVRASDMAKETLLQMEMLHSENGLSGLVALFSGIPS